MASEQGINEQDDSEEDDSQHKGNMCEMCFQDNPTLWRAFPCGRHIWCKECLEDSLESNRGRDLQCCTIRGYQVTPDILELLDPKIVAKYLTRREELKNPPGAYCHSCTEPIANNIIIGDSFATCRKCMKYTCALCDRAWHNGTACAADPELEKLLELAWQKGWMPCPKCRSLSEHNGEGCKDIICGICDTEFCSKCGRRVNSCACERLGYLA